MLEHITTQGAMETCLKYYLSIKENNFAYKCEMPLVVFFCLFVWGFFGSVRGKYEEIEKKNSERIVLTS